MEFLPLEHLIDKTTNQLIELESISKRTDCHVVAPYRICPLGAHIDHQGGPVLSVLGCRFSGYRGCVLGLV